jgi:hypothetical protein
MEGVETIPCLEMNDLGGHGWVLIRLVERLSDDVPGLVES